MVLVPAGRRRRGARCRCWPPAASPTGARSPPPSPSGAQGVWCGSVWLTTEEAETHPVVKEKFLAATSSDTLRSRSKTGKPARQLRSAWTDEWNDPANPDPLGMPLQPVLVGEAERRIARTAASNEGSRQLINYFVGQAVGMMNESKPAATVVFDLVDQYVDAAGRWPPRSPTTEPVEVLVTGAAGRIGRVLMTGLVGCGHEVRGLDHVAADAPWADRLVVADLATDDAALDDDDGRRRRRRPPRRASPPRPTSRRRWRRTCGLAHRVLEAMRRHGVGRIVYASSNHAVGFTPRAADGADRRPGCARTRSTGSARWPAKGCAACTTIATGSRPRACASAASASARRPAGTSRRGCPTATRCASSMPACGRRASGTPWCTASPPTPGRGGT